MEIKNNILEVAKEYDTLFIDMYGVLYDGVALFDKTLDTLEQLKKSGKTIVIVSNASQMASDAKFGYAQRGMIDGVHYDKVVTSGSFLHYFITNHYDEFGSMVDLKNKTYKTLFIGNENVFSDTFIKKVEEDDEADFIYVGVPRSSRGAVRVDDLTENGQPVNIEDILSKDWTKLKNSTIDHYGLAEFAMLLDLNLKNKRTLLVSNPDIFAHGSVDHSEKKVPIVTQGCLGAYYERLGGKVVYFGKPGRGIFDYAKTLVPNSKKIAMVGDTPWTDVLGGKNSEIDTILTLTGIPEEFFEKWSGPIQEKMDRLLNEIAPKLSGKSNGEVTPTWIVKKFASN